MEIKDKEENELNNLINLSPPPIQEKKMQENEGYNCSECSSVIEILYINEDEINFQCINNSDHNKSLKINEYLEKMSKYIENKNLIENCEIHKKQYECYCSNCKYHLCKECLKSKKHKADKKLYFYELQPNDDEIIRIEDKIKYYQDEAVKLEI